MASDPKTPSLALLSKLGSIAVHVEELLSADGSIHDRAALNSLLIDPEVREWLAQMNTLSLLPVKRRA